MRHPERHIAPAHLPLDPSRSATLAWQEVSAVSQGGWNDSSNQPRRYGFVDLLLLQRFRAESSSPADALRSENHFTPQVVVDGEPCELLQCCWNPLSNLFIGQLRILEQENN